MIDALNPETLVPRALAPSDPKQAAGHRFEPVFSSAPARPPSLADGLHLWLVRLDQAHPDALLWLEQADRHRAQAILPSRQRWRWTIGRAALRVLLTSYTGAPPGELQLVTDAAGRTRSELAEAPHFSLAHSGGLALFAFAEIGQLGVDVECAGRGARLARPSVAARLLGPERAARLVSIDHELAGAELLRAWVGREALLKCSHPSPWVAELALGSEAVGAIACAAPPREMRCWELELARPVAWPVDSLTSCRDH